MSAILHVYGADQRDGFYLGTNEILQNSPCLGDKERSDCFGSDIMHPYL